MSRTKIPIDKSELEKWARAGATQPEMAQRLGISLRTLARRLGTKEFRDCLPRAEAELKISLRTKQVQLALSGNPTMLIWLGKNILGQTDKQEVSGRVEHSIEILTFRNAVLSAVADMPEDVRLIIARRLIEAEKASKIIDISKAG